MRDSRFIGIKIFDIECHFSKMSDGPPTSRYSSFAVPTIPMYIGKI